MLGAIAGDIIGSRFEGRPTKTKSFELITPECTYTDDSVLTVAVADCLLNGTDYAEAFKDYYRRYPLAGYGGRFQLWAASGEAEPYFSFENGSAMRVSPVGWFFTDLETVLTQAERCAAVTHNHPEGIKGAQAVALAVSMALSGSGQDEIKGEIQDRFGYNLDRDLADIRVRYSFDVTCQGSVPEALLAFLQSDGYEDAVRNAVSLGGDSDTQACIAGAVAEAYFGGVPSELRPPIMRILDEDLRRVLLAFEERRPFQL